MADPADYQQALQELEKAMLQSQGKQQAPAPQATPQPVQTNVQLPPPEKLNDYKKRAVEDIPRIQSLRSRMEAAAKLHSVPVEYLEGIASRESRGGKALNPETGFDDVKKAYGVMQVDQRYHELEGATAPDSQEHINQAAGILKANKLQMDKKFPKWSQAERWRAAIAAYNMGSGNVRSRENVDKGTTGNDYSQDVLIRSQIFKQRLNTSRKRR